MLWWIFTVTLLLIPIVLSVQTVTLRYSYIGESVVGIDFMYFKALLFPERGRKRKSLKEKLKPSRIKRSLILTGALNSAIGALVSRTDFKITRLNISPEHRSPAELYIKLGSFGAILYSIITYLSLKAKTISTIAEDEERSSFNPTVDFTLQFRLFHLLWATLVFAAQAIKRIIKRRG